MTCGIVAARDDKISVEHKRNVKIRLDASLNQTYT